MPLAKTERGAALSSPLSKPKAPTAPDYNAAAAAQGGANVNSALSTAQLNNANVSNPVGTQTINYVRDPNTGNMTPVLDQRYSAGEQQVFDTNQALRTKLGFLGQGAADQAGDTLSQPLNFNDRFGTQAQGRQGVIDAMMSRYDTDAGLRKDQINSDLVARGIPVGSKAYEVEMDRLSRGRNDALQQATIAADDKAMNERRQMISEALTERQVPLGEIAALMGGSQVSPLQFSGVQGANIAPSPVYGATANQWDATMDRANFQNVQQGGLMNGLFGLGQAYLMSR